MLYKCRRYKNDEENDVIGRLENEIIHSLIIHFQNFLWELNFADRSVFDFSRNLFSQIGPKSAKSTKFHSHKS